MNGHQNHSNATDHHGNTNFKSLYEEIEAANGFSMQKELNALITEIYLSDKYSDQIEKSAALTVGMQKISKHLYDVTMTEMIASDDPMVHELALHALTVSFHRPNMTGGRGHSGEQDMGSYALMHVLNPRKETDNVREWFFSDNELSAAEGAQLRDMFKSGTTFADMFGENGGHSADGWLGESLHPKSLRNLAEWAGVDLPKWAEVDSHRVSLQYEGFDSNNSAGVFLGIGKKRDGGSDLSPPGRDKFQTTLEYGPVEQKLAFTPGEASGTGSSPSIPMDPGHDNGGHDHGGTPYTNKVEAADDAAQTQQNQTVVVDVLENDKGGTLTLTNVEYSGNTSLVSIRDNMIVVNPLSAHRNDRTETVTYTVQDENGNTSTATLAVDIGSGTPAQPAPAPAPAPEPQNQAPEANDDYFTTAQNKTININVLGNDSDPEGGKLTLTDVQYDGNTSLVSIENGQIKVNPLSSARNDRVETITYTIMDDDGQTATATLKVGVGQDASSPTPPAPAPAPEPQNQAPVANDDAATTGQNRTIMVDVLANDSDPEGGAVTLTDVQYSGNTSIVSIENGQIKVNPLSSAKNDRVETITYTIQDSEGETSTGTLKVSIGGGNGGGTPAPAPAPTPQPNPGPDASEGVYLGENGQIVMEAENAKASGAWQKVNVDGETAMYWNPASSNYNRVDDNQSLSFSFKTDQGGTYSLAANAGRDKSGMSQSELFENGNARTDTGNDVYVRVTEVDTGNVVLSPIKMFNNLGGSDKDLRWGGTFDSNHKKSPAQVELKANTEYEIDIIGRSDGYVLDRLTLSNKGQLKDSNVPESDMSGGAAPAPQPAPQPTPGTKAVDSIGTDNDFNGVRVWVANDISEIDDAAASPALFLATKMITQSDDNITGSAAKMSFEGAFIDSDGYVVPEWRGKVEDGVNAAAQKFGINVYSPRTDIDIGKGEGALVFDMKKSLDKAYANGEQMIVVSGGPSSFSADVFRDWLNDAGGSEKVDKAVWALQGGYAQLTHGDTYRDNGVMDINRDNNKTFFNIDLFKRPGAVQKIFEDLYDDTLTIARNGLSQAEFNQVKGSFVGDSLLLNMEDQNRNSAVKGPVNVLDDYLIDPLVDQYATTYTKQNGSQVDISDVGMLGALLDDRDEFTLSDLAMFTDSDMLL